MNNKKINKFNFFLLFICCFCLYFLFPNKISAYNVCGGLGTCNTRNYSPCGGGYSWGAHLNKYADDEYSGYATKCVEASLTSGMSYGYHTCVTDSYSGGIEEKETITTDGRKVRYTKIFVGIFNTWSKSGSGDGWNIDSALKIPACPGMEVTWDKAAQIPSDLMDKADLKITGIKALNNKKEIVENFTSKEMADNIYNWSLENFTVSLINTDISDGYYSYTYYIPSLASKAGGLGMNGRVKGHADYVRAYHYYMPYMVTFEYTNDATTNPCLTGDAEYPTGQQYAYNHPGTCCYEYPETCCNDKEAVVNNKTSRPDVLDFCCLNNEYSYYGIATSLPKLPTFKHYFFENWERDFINPGGICPTCDSESDYYYNTTTDSPSSCCMKNPSRYEDNCTKPEEDCEVSKCSSSTYFNENKVCCCSDSTYESDPRCNKIPERNWADGLSCSDPPTALNATFGTGTIASGTRDDSNGSTYENITFTDYKSLDQMKSNIIFAGTGFEYDVDVRHQIKKSAKTDYDFDEDCTDETCAQNKAKDAINGYLPLLEGEKNNIETASTKFVLKTDSETEYFNSSNFVLANTSTESNSITATYKYCIIQEDGTEYCTSKDTTFTYDNIKIYTYTYNLKLRNQYISKQNASLAVAISEKKEPTEKTVNIYNPSDLKNYLNGGTKFYTETTSTTGIYNFTVELSENNIGATNKLNNASEFKCQYGVVNKITKNDKFDCGSAGNSPCPETKGRGFYFRQISLNNPFPNREAGPNWDKYLTVTEYKYINSYGENDNGTPGDSKNDIVYKKEPMYQVTLTSDLIQKIKKYNRQQEHNNKGYAWDKITTYIDESLDSTSNFLTNPGSFNWTNPIPKIDDSKRQKKVGDF